MPKDQKMVLVPQAELDKLEECRVALCNLLEEEDVLRWKYLSPTSFIYRLANRKWTEFKG